jgi:tetratricopeptide (TPR) repeat protein
MKLIKIFFLISIFWAVTITAANDTSGEKKSSNTTNTKIICQANEGLQLLNQPKPPFDKIKEILKTCDQQTPKDVQVLLLHGLLARKEAMAKKHYQNAINWLQKAKNVAAPDNPNPALELAVTYEWAGQFEKTKPIYEQILTKTPDSRPAQLGLARVALAQQRLNDATKIYQNFLQKNPKDIDALNGIARVKLANKKFAVAKTDFIEVLKLDPNNEDAKIGLKQLQAAQTQISKQTQANAKTNRVSVLPSPRFPHRLSVLTHIQLPACNANEGLRLLTQTNPPLPQIGKILAYCDLYAPNDVQTLLLHGLLARKIAMTTKNYQLAIMWLHKAALVAKFDNPAPMLELAVTYEWSVQPEKARLIYEQVLAQDPQSRPAWLGMARVALAQYHLQVATRIYQAFLQKNPNDIDALNGMAFVEVANQQFRMAQAYFHEVQTINPFNADALAGLTLMENATRYILSIIPGGYLLNGQISVNTNINFWANINATDQILLQLNHWTKELEFGFFTTPTLLPTNSIFVGFQRQIPNKYGWGGAYEFRQHQDLPNEQRFWFNANLYLVPSFQLFGGGRIGTPAPTWNTQLLYYGATLYTTLPVNFSLTGFWGHEEIGGTTTAYSFDLSKEFSNRLFYQVGTAYSPTLHNWDLHGWLILPIAKNQAIEARVQHYFFNSSTYAGLGWRVYW